jgi:type I restriction enzyme S subunit
VEELCPGDAPAVYGIIQPGENVPDGVPYVRPIDMRDDGTVDFDSIKRTTHEIAAQYERASLQAGDVVLSIVGTIGKVILVPKELEGGNITQSSARIRPPSQISSEYLSLALLSPLLIRQFDAFRFGNAVQRLNVEHVRRLAIPIAPESEQAALLVGVHCALDRMPAATATTLHELIRRLEQSILAKAFRGELVPQDPRDEPADELLARVRADRAAPSTPRGRKRAAEAALHD